MKKSKKFILAVLVILIAAIVVILMNPDWFDSNDPVKVEVTEDVQETHDELENEIFD